MRGRLAGDRHDAFAVLARALRDELLDPQAERLEALRQEQRQLVAAALDAPAAIIAPSARPGLSRDRAMPAGAFHRACTSEQASRSMPISAAGTMPKSDSAE